MPASRNTIGMALLAAALFGCGGSLNKGPDGSTGGACSTLGACECMAASDRCSARTEACWCPSECSPNIACICGGGRFLACQDKTAAVSCDAQVTRVKSMCAGMGFIDVIDNFCVNNPTCSAQCLSALTTTGQVLFIVPLNSVPSSTNVCLGALLVSIGIFILTGSGFGMS